MRVGFFAFALFTSKGGIERFSTRITRFLCSRGHECVIFHQGSGDGKSLHPVDERVRTYDLALGNASSIEKVKKLLRDLDLDVLSVMHTGSLRLWFLPICNGSGTPLLMSERCSPHEIETLLWNRQERLASFAAADGIHLLSQSYLSSLPDFLRQRARAIPNPAPDIVPVNWSKEKSPRKSILAMGRLDETQKKLTLLIRAFSQLADDFPDWDCHLCGDGPSKDLYAAMIKCLGLESRIKIMGAVDRVEEFYSSSHIFCMPSAFEGSPNALLEAQSYGLPSVGFSRCGGLNEIIVHGENGLLAPEMTPDCLAKTLRPLMQSSSLRQAMGENAQILQSRYDEKTIFTQWEAMLSEVAAKKSHTRLNFSLPTEEEHSEWLLREILSRENPQDSSEQSRKKPKKQLGSIAQYLRQNLKSSLPTISAVPVALSPPAFRPLIIADYAYNPKERASLMASPAMRSFLADIDLNELRQKIASFGAHLENLSAIRLTADDAASVEPCWKNGWLPPLDGVTIYSFLAEKKPRYYVECGSGNTTKFAARSIRDNKLRTKIISIDPYPRAEIDTLCHKLYRLPFENMDLDFFESLTDEDIFLVDNSHRSFPNSDVTVFFTEILPILPSGMLYALHDIFLPRDYPEEWSQKRRWYNEQYLLYSYLLGGGMGDKVYFPCRYAALTLSDAIAAVFTGPGSRMKIQIKGGGTLFWMQKGQSYAMNRGPAPAPIQDI